VKKLAHQPEQPRNEIEKLPKSPQLNKLIFDNVHDLIAIHKLSDLSYEYVNPAVLEVLGYTRDELFAQSAFELIHPEDMGRVMQRMKDNLPTGEGQDEFRYRKQDGSYVWLEVNGSIMADEAEGGALVIISRDVTGRKEAEAALSNQSESRAPQQTEMEQLDRALEVTRAVTRAVIQSANEDDLLHNVCRQLVEAGGYSLAWVGYVQPDPQQKVKPVAYAGTNNAYLAKLNIYLHDPKRGQGPVGTAIRTSQPVVVGDIKNDEKFKPWAKDALRRGFKSALAIPLLADRRSFGALSLYSAATEAFNDREQKLLQELTNMLAYAVISLRARAGENEKIT